MTEKALVRVKFEISQIDGLFETYADLLEQAQRDEPDLIEVTAIASVLHSFYSGLENIFLLITKTVDKDIPSGPQWHRDLLTGMAESTPHRPAVLTNEVIELLADYLGFRHFYRHSYSYHLNWNELEKLVIPLEEVWMQVRHELQLFVESLSSNRM